MLAVIMLISNQFRYGAFVIATESMTGEINKGGIIIYEEYGDQVIFEGLVIVFEKDSSVIIHRVEKIEIINGAVEIQGKTILEVENLVMENKLHKGKNKVKGISFDVKEGLKV